MCTVYIYFVYNIYSVACMQHLCLDHDSNSAVASNLKWKEPYFVYMKIFILFVLLI